MIRKQVTYSARGFYNSDGIFYIMCIAAQRIDSEAAACSTQSMGI